MSGRVAFGVNRPVVCVVLACLFLGVFLGVGSLARVPSAQAAQDDKPDELIRRGVQLRRSLHDEQALELFRAAYAMRATPLAQAQIGLAEQALGRWVDAERDLGEALEHAGDAWIAKNSGKLRSALVAIRAHLGYLEISGSPSGARVRVDDRDAGVIPFDKPVRVAVGEIVVSVSAPGHTEISRKLSIVAGSLTRETFTLHAGAKTTQPQANKTPEIKPLAARHADNRLVAETTTRPPMLTARSADSEPSHSSALRYWGLASGGVGLLAAGAGTYFGLQAISKNKQSKAGCPGDMCDPPSELVRRQAFSAGNRATIAFVVSGALVATGTLLFVFGRHSESAPLALHLSPVAAPGQVGLLGGLAF